MIDWRGRLRRGRRTPTVLQREASECGAACLAIVLAHHGRWVPLEEMRQATGVSRDGTKASTLIRAAALYGLSASGITCQPANLARLDLPAIVFWNFNHFVVLERRRNDRVWINDPATGPRVVTAGEFDEAFTGVVLTFKRSAEFRAGGTLPSVMRGVRDRLDRFRWALGAVVLTGLLLLAPGLLIPGIQRAFTDFYLVAGLHDWLWWLVGAMAAAAALRMALTYLQHASLLRLQVRLGLQSNGRLLWHILHMPMVFFAQRNAGELANRVDLGDRLSGLLSSSLLIAFVNLAGITVYGIVMLSYDLTLTALVITFAGLNIGLLVAMTRHLSNSHRRMLQEDAHLQALMFQGFASLESFKATGTEDLFFRRWAGAHARVLTAEQAMNSRRRILSNFVSVLGVTTGIAVVLLGGMRVMDGAITVGMLVAFQTLMANFNAPVASFVGLGSQLQDARGYIDRLDDVLNQPIDPMHRVERNVTQPATLEGSLEIRDASFAYSTVGADFVKDFSLSVTPGARIAIVGPSGSGKSTLARLLVGLSLPRSGAVSLDGVSLAEIDNTLLRSSMSYVDQNAPFFPGTIRENITMWDPTIGEARMIEAAKDAMMHDTIAVRPGSYDTPLAEEGRNFSGGERQRLALARALAVDPAVIVLDEATSALDAMAEKTILDNIRRRGCTLVVVSHRLSAIRDCDEIIVIDRGRIAERGRHVDLHRTGALYRRLVDA